MSSSDVEVDEMVNTTAPPTIYILLGQGAIERELIARIIEFARRRNLDQGALAAAAGISPEALSRLKKAGTCRLTTALSLARAAGLTSLELADRPVASPAASIAARKLSAGRRVPIDPGELVGALAGGPFSDPHRGHLCGFFEELPIASVHDVILEEDLDYQALISLARELEVEGDTVEWLADMAGDGVANAA
jgi:DNA-binding phage protein